MRWLAVLGLMAIAACGGEDRTTAAASPQELVIPPMDAGAQAAATSAPVAAQPPRPADERSVSPNEIPQRDPRLARSSVRAAADVASMIQLLEQGVAGMPANDPKTAIMLRHLADLYEELATVSHDDAVARAARGKEAAHLATLINGFPAYPQLDEARYFRALTFERLHDLRNARSVYYDLIKNNPSSKYIANAYFAFGELFFDEAKSDPSKWDLAKQAYTETLKYPPPSNELFPFALLRMGEIATAQGDAANAQSSFDRLRHDFPNSPAAKRIPRGQ